MFGIYERVLWHRNEARRPFFHSSLQSTSCNYWLSTYLPSRLCEEATEAKRPHGRRRRRPLHQCFPSASPSSGFSAVPDHGARQKYFCRSDEYISGSPPWILWQVRTRRRLYCCIVTVVARGGRKGTKERKKEPTDFYLLRFWIASDLLVWMSGFTGTAITKLQLRNTPLHVRVLIYLLIGWLLRSFVRCYNCCLCQIETILLIFSMFIII